MDDQNNKNNPPPNPPNPPPIRPQPRRPSPPLELSLSHNPPPPAPAAPPPPQPPPPPQTRSRPPPLRLDLTISPPGHSDDSPRQFHSPPAAPSSSNVPLTPSRRKKRTKVVVIDTPGPSSGPSSAPSSLGRSPSSFIGSSSRTGPLTGDHLTLGSPSSSNPFSRQNKQPNAPEVSTPCTECGKTFKSLKALYGHMRCHPERTWRGINPPSNQRQLPALPSPPPTPATDTDMAKGLLLLSVTAKEMGAMARANANAAAGRGSDVAGTSAQGARYECASCKKTFPTFQALGGHRASHKNVKGCYANTKPPPSASTEPQAMEVDEERNDPVKDSAGGDDEDDDLGLALALSLGHRCSICMKVFPTGQALGGHMRCHYDQPSSSTGPGDDQGMRDAQSGVDLNQPGPSRRGGDDGSSSSKSDSDELDLSLGL